MSHDFWYLSRAAGFTAYGLLFISTALGILIGARLTPRFARNAVFDIHRFTSILALAISVFHVAILLGDGFFDFTIPQLIVPFLSPYRPWPTAAGVIGLYLMAVIVASFYVRNLTGYRAWRAIHFATFALFGLVTVHGTAAGTDAAAGWARLIYAGAGLTLLALVLLRVLRHVPVEARARRVRMGAAATASLAAVLVVIWAGLIRPSLGDEDSAAVVASAASVELPSVSQVGSVPHDDDDDLYRAGDDEDEDHGDDDDDDRDERSRPRHGRDDDDADEEDD